MISRPHLSQNLGCRHAAYWLTVVHPVDYADRAVLTSPILINNEKLLFLIEKNSRDFMLWLNHFIVVASVVDGHAVRVRGSLN